jgi:amino acid transporter
VGFLGLLLVAVGLNLIGLNIGKWLQNAGGVGTYIPLLILVVVAPSLPFATAPVTHFTARNMLPTLELGHRQLLVADCFRLHRPRAGLCHERRGPRPAPHSAPRRLRRRRPHRLHLHCRNLRRPRARARRRPRPAKRRFHAIAIGSVALRIGFLGILAAVLVTVGNAGGVGSTVAGIARVPFVVGIDRYLPAAFGKIHPRWRTPWVSILVQGGLSGLFLLLSQINDSTRGAYQSLVDAAIILYFIPFLYMFAAVIRLARRPDRASNPHAILVPGGSAGTWICGSLGFLIVLVAIFFSVIPPGDTSSRTFFEFKVVLTTLDHAAILLGLILYWRGARTKLHS